MEYDVELLADIARSEVAQKRCRMVPHNTNSDYEEIDVDDGGDEASEDEDGDEDEDIDVDMEVDSNSDIVIRKGKQKRYSKSSSGTAKVSKKAAMEQEDEEENKMILGKLHLLCIHGYQRAIRFYSQTPTR